MNSKSIFEGRKPVLYNKTFTDLNSMLESWGEPKYRSIQIWQGLYKHFWNSIDQYTVLPKSLREKLTEAFQITSLVPVDEINSSDGNTKKVLFELQDDQTIESVLMQYRSRNTLCISTQAGCGMGCVFCATGQMGLMRNLTNGEIVEQVIYFSRILNKQNEKVTNIVFMGMGEPFHNYNSLMHAIDQLNDPNGYNLGSRRMTISTVGLIPEIRRFTSEKRQVNLAISLHAADDDLRNSMLPINKKYPLSDLMKACEEYVQTTGRRITFEWALIHGVNDTNQQAHKLASLLRSLIIRGSALCHVNLIPLNPTEGYDGFPSIKDRVNAFHKVLIDKQIPTTIRTRRGIDIQAGCGQLAVKARKP